MTEAEELELLELEQEAAKARRPAPAPAQPAMPRVGAGETALNASVNALPLGKPVVDALSGGLLHALRPSPSGVALTPNARGEMAAQGIPLQEAPPAPGLLDDYRAIRDARTQRDAAGSQQHPLAHALGTAGGIGLSLLAPLPKATVGAGMLGRIGSGALTAGAYGGVNALANGPADLTRGDVGQALSDVAGVEGFKQALQHGREGRYGRAALDVMGAGAPGAMLTGGALSAAAEGARPLAGALRNLAINQGRRVLTNGADSLSTRAPIREAAVNEALSSGAIRPFSTTAATLERLQGLTEEQAARYSKIVADLEAQGVRGPEVRSLADSLFQRYEQGLPNTGASKAVPEVFLNEAINVENVAGGQPRLGLTQAEEIKRALQRQAKFGRFDETPLNEARREAASIVRQANEEAIAQQAGSGTPAGGLAEQFVPVKQRLGNLIEAETAAERGAARGAQRGHFGIKEAMHAAAATAAGHPGAAPLMALGSNFLRNRGTSAAAAYAYRLANALNNGDVGSTLARQAEVVANPLMTPAFGPTAPAMTADNETTRRARALAEVLRRQAPAQ
jgi:hypothetical protein